MDKPSRGWQDSGVGSERRRGKYCDAWIEAEAEDHDNIKQNEKCTVDEEYADGV